MRFEHGWPRTVAAVYAALVLGAIALPFLARDGLAGIWAILLSSPWSLLLLAGADAALPAFFREGTGAAVLVLIGGLLNAVLVWLVAGLAARARR